MCSGRSAPAQEWTSTRRGRRSLTCGLGRFDCAVDDAGVWLDVFSDVEVHELTFYAAAPGRRGHGLNEMRI